MRRVLLASLLLAACTGEVDQALGLFEPIRVQEGTLVEGDLPEAGADGPRVTSIEAASGILTLGQQHRLLGGRTTDDAYAIAIRFAGIGGGWWTRPVQDADPMYPGERDFQLRYDVGPAVPPAIHTLELAALNAEGERGPTFELEVCVRDGAVPDNLNACDPTLRPPALVVALQWDRPVDLDLVVEVPGGKRILHDAPTANADAFSDPTTGRLTRDSNGACELDGRSSEAVVWQEPPPSGSYLVYADLFDACGQPGALFAVVVYRRVERDDGTFALVEDDRAAGAVVDLQASGGAGSPLYVMEVEQP